MGFFPFGLVVFSLSKLLQVISPKDQSLMFFPPFCIPLCGCVALSSELWCHIATLRDASSPTTAAVVYYSLHLSNLSFFFVFPFSLFLPQDGVRQY